MDLFQAVIQDDVEMVAEILASGVNPNINNMNFTYAGEYTVYKSATPLHIVKSEAVARLLIEHNADVNKRDCFEYTPLHNSVCPKISSLLIQNGVDVNAAGYHNKTPLLVIVASDELTQCYPPTQNELARVLLENKADPNHKEDHGFGSLHLASSECLVRTLLEFQADPNMQRYDHGTPLHSANDKGAIIALLEYGADPKATNMYGQYPWENSCSSSIVKSQIIHQFIENNENLLIKSAR